MHLKFTPLILSIILMAGCKKDINNPDYKYESDAVIAGYATSDQGCPGGYYINMISNPQTNTEFWAKEMPTGSGISPNMVFPVRILLNWEMDSVYCNGQYIKVQNLKRK